MKVSVYNPTNGNLIADTISGISYGNVRRGEHSVIPVLIKPGKTTESNFTEMKLFLQNDGGLTQTQFGHFASDQFVSGADYTNVLSDHFLRAPTVTGISYNTVTGLEIGLQGGTPVDFVWLDTQVGASEVGSTSTINYRFVFEYN